MRGCHVMAKPTSSQCNIQCQYCFYLDKPQQPVMDDATVDVFIRQHIAAQPGDMVEFAWQGGEPTLAGLPFYQRVVALQKRYSVGKRIQNNIQTNGILLNDAWCQFFKENGWLVGISIDGPADLHDHYRRTRSDKPTHQLVVAAIEKLKAHRIEFNLLVVVSQHNSQQPERLYRYLRTLGTPFLQFIPLVEHDPNGNLTVESVQAKQWGTFLNTVFKLWAYEDIGRVFVQLFDSTLGVWAGFPSQMCVLSKTCGHAFALEANGALYQCDHYVAAPYLLGNIHETSLKMLNQSQQAQAFAQQKFTMLSADCHTCSELQFCHGDCPKHRIKDNKSALCEGYRAFFRDTAPYMKTMRDLIRQHRSPTELMLLLRNTQ